MTGLFSQLQGSYTLWFSASFWHSCRTLAAAPKENDGFIFAGDELTRGAALRCWPEVLPGMLGITPENGHCGLAGQHAELLKIISEAEETTSVYASRFDF